MSLGVLGSLGIARFGNALYSCFSDSGWSWHLPGEMTTEKVRHDYTSGPINLDTLPLQCSPACSGSLPGEIAAGFVAREFRGVVERCSVRSV